ncbi:ABC transporter ATP-binding protein [Brockia lithotrophica]|uniref:Carbohydrate ABC transporter ATP-binding protein (CUT1 family) n=1 Tax=Brockia lithotrophica TaxID=933949 RepID=A0A660L7F8_9BACL|nr:ABC transporter ATP-binding protein [Brockia lithotrophica]RKQ88779.1 carbohydrate ABC transporter ATP-binding protein (CUT1 family) [Brockia lithotrophica]
MRVALERVSMRFGKVTAVDALSVEFASGEFVVILGPSGCGKSTTLFLLAGLYVPTEGEIRFDGRVVNALPPERRNVGLVFQNYALYPHMSVFENIAFPLHMQRRPREERRERVLAVARMLYIDHLLERKPSQLSGGQQQRVAIARALVKRPDLLLLDEPLSNLDARLRLEMREEIRRVQREVGITTVLVTHDQEEALSLADRILVMRDGKAVQFAPPEELYEFPLDRFVAHFVGNPPMNFFPAEYAGSGRFSLSGGLEVQVSPEEFAELRPGAAYELGVRPEAASLRPSRSEGTPPFPLLEAGEGAEGSPAANEFPGLVVHREVVGRDVLYKVRTSAGDLRLVAPSSSPYRAGDRVIVGIDASRVHVFDADGKNLRLRVRRDADARDSELLRSRGV